MWDKKAKIQNEKGGFFLILNSNLKYIPRPIQCSFSNFAEVFSVD